VKLLIKSLLTGVNRKPQDVLDKKLYKLEPWNVTQRIRRMNKKLDRLIGQKTAEKIGKGWVLTSFMREV